MLFRSVSQSRYSFEKIEQAQVVMYLVDSVQCSVLNLESLNVEMGKIKNQFPLKPVIVVLNKVDQLSQKELTNILDQLTTYNIQPINISAKNKEGIEDLKNQLLSFVNTGALRNNETIVTNTRHYDSLLEALEEIQKVTFGLNSGLSSDLMAIDIKQASIVTGKQIGRAHV